MGNPSDSGSPTAPLIEPPFPTNVTPAGLIEPPFPTNVASPPADKPKTKGWRRLGELPIV